MSSTRKLWFCLASLLVGSFAVLLFMGGEIYRKAPPLPDRVVAEDGALIYHARRHRTRPPGLAVDRRHAARLDLGPRRLRRAGLERRLAASRSGRRARRAGRSARAAAATTRSTPSSRRRCRPPRARGCARNTYDRRDAHDHARRRSRRGRSREVAAHYESLFGNDPATAELRETYAMQQRHGARCRRIAARSSAFFWWTAWAGRDRAARTPSSHLHEQLAERAAGRQPAAPSARSCGRRSACCS